jgi:hypothetical protein
LDGFRVVFTRIKNGQLNPDDSYESCWLGGRGGGPEVTLSGNGNPIIGIHGRHGADIDAIGLVQTTAQRASGLEPVR